MLVCMLDTLSLHNWSVDHYKNIQKRLFMQEKYLSIDIENNF